MDRLKMGMCVATMRFLLDYSTIRLRGPECKERNNKSLVSDISGLPGVSNELDNPTYETTTVIQKLE
ncbi:hypothetical protein T06_4146 [Trichinella sp. T6]|nr:hypothetical protein T06_4146 [Trichinella sp. T6]